MSQEIVIITPEEMEAYARKTAEEEAGFGALQTENGPLPLKALDVVAHLDGLVGEVSINQAFVNTHNKALEATYIFPLPDRAAVTQFQMTVGERVIEGTLKERAVARQEYEDAVKEGHRAGIAEEERPGVFTLRVGNLGPGETAKIRLTLVGPLVYDTGEVTFRFPLVVAPRYIPGTPLDGRSVGDGTADDTDAVPDASRISPPMLLPGFPNPVRFSLDVEVQGPAAAECEFKSSLHAVILESRPGGGTRIRVAPGERLNRDFILRYRVGQETIGTSLAVVPDDSSANGSATFLLTVLPPATQAVTGQPPRDVVFVFDRSGSMAGWKMVAARRALARMIDALTDHDRFAVLAFDDAIERSPQCEHATASATDRNRFQAIEWLAKIEAGGGTEMAQPLVQALTMLDRERDRVLVLLTDGQVGNEDQILQALAAHLMGIRIFTLGIDRAVNEGFLRRLAALGGGSCDIVESEDRLDEVMQKVQRRIGSPILTSVQIDGQGIGLAMESLVPAKIPDLFPGVPLIAMGRCRSREVGALKVTATNDAGRPWSQSAPVQFTRHAAIASLWARGKIRDLEDRWVVATYEARPLLEKDITELSLRWSVLCRFTAFVAVDRSEKVEAGGKPVRLVQPVELPDGWQLPDANAGVLARFTYASDALFLSKSAGPSGPMSSGDSLCGFVDASLEAIEDCSPADEGVDAFLASTPDADSSSWEPMQSATLLPPLPAVPFIVQDLLAYRQRAKTLLEQLKADNAKDHGLAVLRLHLQALIDDLHSVGVAGEDLQSLVDLLADLDQLKMPLEKRCARALQILEEFAEKSCQPGRTKGLLA